MRNAILSAVVVLSGLCSGACAQEFIRVGSFNIANLGDTKEYERSLISLVNITRKMDADLICLQEVEPNELGTEQVERYVGLLNKAAAFYDEDSYEFLVVEMPEGEFGDETTAYVWRDPVNFDSQEIMLMDHDEDPDDDGVRTFQRPPTMGFFSAGNLDFWVVNCHLYTKLTGATSEGRGAEYAAIAAWFETLAIEEDTDGIVLGDFNRFLSGKREWSTLMHEDHEDFYRFALLEAIEDANTGFDPMKHEAPSDEFSTTTSKKKSIYDQILISKGLDHEFTPDPKIGTDVGIIAFDTDSDFEWVTGKWSDATKHLSDHRPVWIRLRTDLADDD